MVHFLPANSSLLEQSNRQSSTDPELQGKQNEQRAEILAAMHGDEESMEILLGLIDGELTYREMAEHLGVDHSTVFRRSKRMLDDLKWSLIGRLGRERLIYDGGFTIDTHRGLPLGSELDMWVVAVDKDRERRYPVLPTSDDIAIYGKEHSAVFQRELPQRFLGGWVSLRGECFLDIVILVADKAEAIAIALRNGQRSIYHLRTGESHYFGDDIGRRAA